MKTIAVLAVLALFFASPIRADGPCYQDPYGQTECPQSSCDYSPTSYWAVSTATYGDWSESYWSAAIYQDSCTGDLMYIWTPRYVYCPDWQNCQAHNLYPNLPPLP